MKTIIVSPLRKPGIRSGFSFLGPKMQIPSVYSLVSKTDYKTVHQSLPRKTGATLKTCPSAGVEKARSGLQLYFMQDASLVMRHLAAHSASYNSAAFSASGSQHLFLSSCFVKLDNTGPITEALVVRLKVYGIGAALRHNPTPLRRFGS